MIVTYQINTKNITKKICNKLSFMWNILCNIKQKNRGTTVSFINNIRVTYKYQLTLFLI